MQQVIMTKKPHCCQIGLATAVLMAFLNIPASGADAPPDLTRGETNQVDRKLTYNLGPTGLRGWIYTKPATFLDSAQGRTTTASRQILVTHVGDKSPADGVMKVDDVILGAGGKLFTDDARKSLAMAIQEAEKTAKGGILKLTRWRAGSTEEVQLKLRAMGTYSDTAPYNCPKSKRILDEACKVLATEPLKEDWSGAVSGLALLACGNPEYLPRVREFARKMGPPTLKLQLKDGMVVWDWGYRNLFLCEYYLLAGDKEVRHAIHEYTVALVMGGVTHAAPPQTAAKLPSLGVPSPSPSPADSAVRSPASREDGFVSLFDGKTLDGWHAVPKESAADWSVEDGIIVGRGSANRLVYLVWKDADLADFELQMRYRLPGKGNTGVEIRSQPDLTGKRPFEGYHADLGHVGIGPHILGAWDFHFAKRREPPCPRGTRLLIDENDLPLASPISGALTADDVHRDRWNLVRIVAHGNRFQFFINGKLSSEFTDNAKRGRLDRGAIGLQIHDKGMQVEFKDIRLKRLTPAKQPSTPVK